MSKADKTKKRRRNCHHCANCIYIGEGDFYCDQKECIVLTDFTSPTEDYFKCKGERWERND